MANLVNPDQTFWKGKKVLVTGHTGFKGRWLSHWLTSLGCVVLGVSKGDYPQTFISEAPRDLLGASLNLDINSRKFRHAVVDFQPEIVFHMAAQSLVSMGYLEPLGTYRTNVAGGIAILEILDEIESIHTCIFVTTDKVYKPEGAMPFLETSELGGSDPYSKSKAMIEMIVESCNFRKGLRIATVRSGNVIGGGDISSTRLLPDIVRAWQTKKILNLRNSNGVRPWMHVLEPLRGYLLMAQFLDQKNIDMPAMNFGPSQQNHVKVAEIADLACGLLGVKIANEKSTASHHETGLLKINASRAEEILKWNPYWGWEKATTNSIRWYQDYYLGCPVEDLFHRDLTEYLQN